MIPYFLFDKILIGSFYLHTWGLLVGLGILAALGVSMRMARRRGLNGEVLWDWAVWIIAAAFFGARLVHVFLYDWPSYSAHPLEILKFWQGGLSSFGGFLGAAAAFVIYARVKKINFWPYANAIMYGFPLGIGIGRVGCFINHLHVGKLSNSPLAVDFPGGARLDMGLIESLLGFLLFIVYFLFFRKTAKQIFLPLTMLVYGLMRLVLDFSRASDIAGFDARYAGLTPAQYGSLLLIVGGAYLFLKRPTVNSYNFIS